MFNYFGELRAIKASGFIKQAIKFFNSDIYHKLNELREMKFGIVWYTLEGVTRVKETDLNWVLFVTNY